MDNEAKALILKNYCSEESEKYVIGGLFKNFQGKLEIFASLKPEYFCENIAKNIAKVALIQLKNGEDIDPVSTLDLVEGSKEEAKEFILKSIESFVSNSYLKGHINRIKSLYEKRLLQDILYKNFAKLKTGKNSQTIIEELSGDIDAAKGSFVKNEKNKDFYKMLDMIDFNSNNKNKKIYINTGFKDIDDTIGGTFMPGEIIILAARPSVGKTSLAVNLAYKNLLNDKTTLFFSLENSAESISEKFLSLSLKIDSLKFRDNDFNQEELDKIEKFKNDSFKLPLIINDSGNLNVDNIVAFSKNLQSEKGEINLIVLDYLQLVYDNKYIGQRNYEIGEILRKLKALAKNIGCPILILSQINREYSKNNAVNNSLGEPGLFDLKDSGSIEENADFVLFIYKTQKEMSDVEEVGFFVAKNRSGKQGLKTKKTFIKKFCLFQ